jgi:hypothetical protein
METRSNTSTHHSRRLHALFHGCREVQQVHVAAVTLVPHAADAHLLGNAQTSQQQPRLG